jgi:acyl carrier protein
MSSPVDEVVRAFAARQFDVALDQLDLDTPLADVSDSLGLSVLVVNLEERFGIAISDGEVAKARVVGDLARIVEARLHAARSS